MGNVPICYRNIKLLYFPHDQFLYYRLLGREKEQKKKIWHMFYNTNYHILQNLEIQQSFNYYCCYDRLNNIVSTIFLWSNPFYRDISNRTWCIILMFAPEALIIYVYIGSFSQQSIASFSEPSKEATHTIS